MNMEKSALRIDVASDIGNRIEDSLEAARKEVATAEGASQAFFHTAKAIEGLMAHVDKDVTEGKFDLTVATTVKRYLERAVNATKNLGVQTDQERVAAIGKVSALDGSVKMIAKYRDEEARKIAATREAIVQGSVSVEDVGRPVGKTIKEQRLEEERESAVNIAPVPATQRRRRRVVNS